MPAKIYPKRIRRMKLSKVLEFDCKGLHEPCVKWAETCDELKQAFSLVHREYLALGYIKQPDPSGMYFGAHNFLPETATLVVESESKVVATLTHVPDSPKYGLPMESIYSTELNALRRKGRKIAELCALVTSKKLRWKNIFMQMCRIAYNHALSSGLNDVCIMVNPKHVEFYKLVFMFEPLGPERHYPTLGVPAVALRLNLDKSKACYEDQYGAQSSDCDLYSFLHTSAGAKDAPCFYDLQPPEQISSKMMSYFGVDPAYPENLVNAGAKVAAA